jgi:hypothetical protein
VTEIEPKDIAPLMNGALSMPLLALKIELLYVRLRRFEQWQAMTQASERRKAQLRQQQRTRRQARPMPPRKRRR